jgi:hypothetical protein
MTVFGVVAHVPLAMMVMAGTYGLRAPAMVTIGVASVVIGDRASYTSQPAMRADSPAHRLRDTMTSPAMDAAFDVQAQTAESGDRWATRCYEHT